MQFNLLLYLLLAVLSLSWAPLAYGQKPSRTDDYIVTSQGDTLKGRVKSEKERRIRFQQTGDTSFKTYTVHDLKCYYVNKRQAANIPVIIKTGDQPTFLRLKERGRIDLFVYEQNSGDAMFLTGGFGPTRMVGGYGGKSNLLYVRKDGGPLIRIKKKRSTLISLMPEATDLIARINNDGSFNEETITKYVHLYNQYSQER